MDYCRLSKVSLSQRGHNKQLLNKFVFGGLNPSSQIHTKRSPLQLLTSHYYLTLLKTQNFIISIVIQLRLQLFSIFHQIFHQFLRIPRLRNILQNPDIKILIRKFKLVEFLGIVLMRNETF